MLHFWSIYRNPESLHFPEQGSMMDQAAIMIDALSYMNAVYHRLTQSK